MKRSLAWAVALVAATVGAAYAQCQGGSCGGGCSQREGQGCENEARTVSIQLPVEGRIHVEALEAAATGATAEEGEAGMIVLSVPLRGHGASVRLSAILAAAGEDAAKIRRNATPLRGLFGVRLSGLQRACCSGRAEEAIRGIEGVEAVRLERNEDGTAVAIVASTRGITYGAVRAAFESSHYRLEDVEWYACCKVARGEPVTGCCRLRAPEGRDSTEPADESGCHEQEP